MLNKQKLITEYSHCIAVYIFNINLTTAHTKSIVTRRPVSRQRTKYAHSTIGYCKKYFLLVSSGFQAEASDSQIKYVYMCSFLPYSLSCKSHFRNKAEVINCESALQIVAMFFCNNSTGIVFLLNRFRTTLDLSQDSRSEKCDHLARGTKQRAGVMDRVRPFPLFLQLLRKV